MKANLTPTPSERSDRSQSNNHREVSPASPTPNHQWDLSQSDLANLMGRDRLAQSLELEERPHNGYLLGFLAIVVGALGMGVLWAAITPVERVVIASGEVIPEGDVQPVEHLEGGIVENLSVKEGDRVRRGQVLMEISSKLLAPERDQVKARLAHLDLERQQLLNMLGRPSAIVPRIDTPKAGRLQESQQQLLAAKLALLQTQIEVVERQVAQRVAEIAKFDAQEAAFLRELALLKEQAGIYERLESDGAVAHISVLQAQREVAAAETGLAELRGTREVSRRALRESEAHLAELRAQFRVEDSQRFAAVENETAELEQSIKRNEDQLRRLKVVSPVDGIVHSLQVETVGGIVAPGSVVAKIVPLGRELLVEARVLPKDIAGIRLGEEVEVKVQAYDYVRFGIIKGTVQSISASTFTEQTGQSFYKVEIALAQPHVGDDPQKNLILPGMTVTADILTGEESLLQYLLGPAVRNITEALEDRG